MEIRSRIVRDFASQIRRESMVTAAKEVLLTWGTRPSLVSKLDWLLSAADSPYQLVCDRMHMVSVTRFCGDGGYMCPRIEGSIFLNEKTTLYTDAKAAEQTVLLFAFRRPVAPNYARINGIVPMKEVWLYALVILESTCKTRPVVIPLTPGGSDSEIVPPQLQPNYRIGLRVGTRGVEQGINMKGLTMTMPLVNGSAAKEIIF